MITNTNLQTEAFNPRHGNSGKWGLDRPFFQEIRPFPGKTRLFCPITSSRLTHICVSQGVFAQLFGYLPRICANRPLLHNYSWPSNREHVTSFFPKLQGGRDGFITYCICPPMLESSKTYRFIKKHTETTQNTLG